MGNASTSDRPGRRDGFTLIESTISIVILAVMVVMALNTLGSSARSKRIQASLSRGPALAGHLMTEVLQGHYEEPNENETVVFGPEASETGGTRAAFDDVDDYHGWSASPPQDKGGTEISGLTGWRRSVTVVHVNPKNLKVTVGAEKGVKQITVTVTSSAGEQFTLTALRSNVSGYDQFVAAETTFVSWVGVELQLGGDADARVRMGVNLLNQLPGQE